MVNIKDNIGHYIQHPTAIQKSDVDPLKQLAERYPYCSTLSILLLEGYHQYDFVAYEHFLSQAAVLSPDRERLHQILEYQQEQEQTVEEKKDQATPETEPEEQETSAPILEPPVSQLEEVQETTDSQNKEETEAPTSQKEYDDFEKQLIASAVSASILSEVDQEEEEAFDFSSFRQKKEELDSTVKEDEETDQSDNSDQLKTEEEPESFIDFLKKVKHREELRSDSSVQPQESSEKEDTEEETERASDRKNQIVDRFIDNPEVKKRSSFFSPTETAKRSLQENMDNVSETLAKIHELQGNYGKAIQTYEKLILKFPEKKSFFANRIEELKKK